MKRKLRREIKGKYESEIANVANLLLTDADESQVSSSINKAEAYAKILGASGPNREIFWAIGIALLCVLIGGLLWSRHTANSKFLLNLRSDAIRIRTAKKWSQQENFAETRLVPNGGIQIMNSDDIKIAGRSCGPSLTLSGSTIQLTKLSLEAHSEIELVGGQNYLSIFIKQSSAHGEFTYVGDARSSEEKSPCISKQEGARAISVPETISFKYGGQSVTPLALNVRPPTLWPFRNLEVDSIDFSQELPPGSGEFETTINKGSITLYDSQAVHEFREGDRLKLEGVSGRCLKIWAEDGINAICELASRDILLGPKGSEKNLAPTYLEYLYHKKPLGFLWSSVVFLWGILWGVRQFFRR